MREFIDDGEGDEDEYYQEDDTKKKKNKHKKKKKKDKKDYLPELDEDDLDLLAENQKKGKKKL